MGGFGAGNEGGGIGRKLWMKSRNKWVLAVFTPFILCLDSGKLDSHSFLHCVSQHPLFLQASLKAYEMAEECADDDDDKSAIRKVMFNNRKEIGELLDALVVRHNDSSYTDFCHVCNRYD